MLDSVEPPGVPSPTGGPLYLHAVCWVLFDEGRLEEALDATKQLEAAASWMQAPLGVDWRLPRALALSRPAVKPKH